MSSTKKIVLVGASGFVGKHVAAAFLRRGIECITVRTPRDSRPASIAPLDKVLSDADVLVNAAGVSTASAFETETMDWANARLPGLLAKLASRHDIRLVHISTAAVLGNAKTISSTTETRPRTPYSKTKAQGETAALRHHKTVVYRPPGVHGHERTVTQAVARFARSPLSSVADPGTGTAPHALVENVADAIVHLALTEDTPPPIVHHPTEHLSTNQLLHALGGRPPRRLSPAVTRFIVRSTEIIGGPLPPIGSAARRLDVMWHGQEISCSWFDEQQWQPAFGHERWRFLGNEIRRNRLAPNRRVLFGVTSGVSAPPFFEGLFERLVDAGWDVSLVSSPDGNVKEFTNDAGASFIPIRTTRNPSPLSDLRSLVDLLWILVRRKPHVTVWGTPKVGLLGVLASRISGRTAIYVVHGLRYQGANGWKRRALMVAEAIACRSSQYVVAVGYDIVECLVSDHIAPRHRVRVLGDGSANGVSVPTNDRDTSLRPDSVRFVFIGRITKDKGVLDLLKAWPTVRKYVPTSELHIYGRREADMDDDTWGQALSHTQGVIEHGHIAHLRDAYQRAHVLVLPTYREGLPTVVLEAAVERVPAIVTDVPGAREPVVDGVTALIVPPRDPSTLAEAMINLAQNDVIRSKMGTAAREYVADKYSQNRVHDAWLDFFDSFVEPDSNA